MVSRDRLRCAAFTLVEISIVMAIVGLLASMAGSRYVDYLEKARIARAASEIASISRVIDAQVIDGLTPYPNALNEIDAGDILDPWGNSYQYLRLDNLTSGSGKKSSGPKPRKDRFLVPINTDYDLYSMGPNGLTAPSVTSVEGRDDVVRARNGAYFGIAERY